MIDLHIHSTYSDGTYSVKEILEKAEKLKLKYISITDHDNCKAHEELKRIDIKKYFSGKIIPGIEIKTIYKGRILDLLGYNLDTVKIQDWLDEFYKDKKREDIQLKYFEHLYRACIKANLKMTDKDKFEWNPKKDWATVKIYYDIKKYEENKEKVPEDFWDDFSNFSKKYCADFNSDFYIDKSNDYPKLEDAIDKIHECNGKAIIAHVFIYKWAKDKKEFINDLKTNYKIDGFECYHSNFSENEIEFICKYCRENDLLMTGGSDCHGENKPGINLAIGRGNLNISEDIIKNWI